VSNRLSEWLTCHEEDFCISIACKTDTFTTLREVNHISMMIYLIGYHDIPFCDQYCCRVSLRKCCSELTFSIESDIIEFYRRKGLCRSFYFYDVLVIPELLSRESTFGTWIPCYQTRE